MGMSKLIKQAMLDKGMKNKDMAEKLGKTAHSYANWLYRDEISTTSLIKVADILGCDVVLRDRKTGKLYR